MTKCRAATGRTRLNVFASDPQDEHGTQKHANIQIREREDMGRHGSHIHLGVTTVGSRDARTNKIFFSAWRRYLCIQTFLQSSIAPKSVVTTKRVLDRTSSNRIFILNHLFHRKYLSLCWQEYRDDPSWKEVLLKTSGASCGWIQDPILRRNKQKSGDCCGSAILKLVSFGSFP